MVGKSRVLLVLGPCRITLFKTICFSPLPCHVQWLIQVTYIGQGLATWPVGQLWPAQLLDSIHRVRGCGSFLLA